MSKDVIDLLIADHREVEQMLQRLTAEPAERRRDLADALIGQLVRHSVAEEAIVYPVMEAQLPDGHEAVEHDKKEHKELDSIMKQMEAGEAGGPDFFDLVNRLQTVLADHISDEEDKQFPGLKAALDPQVRSSMGLAVEALKHVAPTRPHPDSPQTPLFHLTVGPGIGLVDRLRDALMSKTKVYTGAGS